jgi:hypothetical protein
VFYLTILIFINKYLADTSNYVSTFIEISVGNTSSIDGKQGVCAKFPASNLSRSLNNMSNVKYFSDKMEIFTGKCSTILTGRYVHIQLTQSNASTIAPLGLQLCAVCF